MTKTPLERGSGLNLLAPKKCNIYLKRFAFLLIAFGALGAPNVFAKVETHSPVPHPFFWEVTGPQGQIAHLMGTMHIPDERWEKLPPSLLKALDSADAVYGELNLTDKEAMSAQMMERALLKGGETLEKLIGNELYQELDEYLKGRGQSALFMNGMHPKMAEMTLGLLDIMPLLINGKPVLDEWLLQRAKRAGKEVGGVETVEEQLNALFFGDLEDAKNSLRFTLKLLKEKEAAGIRPFDSLLKAYFSGRESSVLAVLEDELKDAPQAQLKAMEQMLDKRNEVMIDRVVKLLKAQPTRRFVFAFGVAHFVGPRGIVNGLKKRGFQVKRSFAPTPMKE